MTNFDDIERRCFELTDTMQVGESLLSAMVADERIAEAWEADAFLDMSFDECQATMHRMWDAAKAESLAFLNRRFWTLNIERTFS